MTKTVLFLCTGNYYRSRFAEIVFNAEAARRGLPWRAESRGLALERGVNNVGPLSAHASKRLAEVGTPFDAYLRMPQGVADADLESAALVIGLKGAEHRPLLEERHPGWAGRVELWEVHDDYDLHPDEVLPALEGSVRELIARLAAEGG